MANILQQVWITKDGVPIILHGGDNGEMREFTGDSTFVFDYTYEELLAFDVGDGERIPTLQQLFELIKK